MELREDQREVLRRALEVLRNYPVLAIEAPPGWGKTVVVTAIIKEMRGRWIWSSSLLSAMLQVANILRELNIRYYLSGGRERLCLRNLRHADFVMGACTGCAFNKPVPKDMATYTLYTEVKDLGENIGICPYEIQEHYIRHLLRHSDDVAIIMHYDRVPKFLRWARGLILDEVHNIYLPRVTTLQRRVVEWLLEELGINDPSIINNAQAIKDLLAERLSDVAAVNSDFINDVVSFVESDFTYYSREDDAYVGVRISDLPLSQFNGRVVMMSATIPPSLRNKIPMIKVPPKPVTAKIVKWARPMTAEYVETHEDEIVKRLRELIDGQTLIFTTTSKEIGFDDVIYEDELRLNEHICKKSLVLKFFGRYAEGARLNCYRRIILLTVPLLPAEVMRKIEATKGITQSDVVVLKTIQAIGRIFPRDDYEIWLIDSRFKQYCSELANYGVKCVDAG